jgi:hypothetical protein
VKLGKLEQGAIVDSRKCGRPSICIAAAVQHDQSDDDASCRLIIMLQTSLPQDLQVFSSPLVQVPSTRFITLRGLQDF